MPRRMLHVVCRRYSLHVWAAHFVIFYMRHGPMCTHIHLRHLRCINFRIVYRTHVARHTHTHTSPVSTASLALARAIHTAGSASQSERLSQNKSSDETSLCISAHRATARWPSGLHPPARASARLGERRGRESQSERARAIKWESGGDHHHAERAALN